jgi:hypothetical protein
MQNAYFFCIFNILKLKMHGLKINLIYKPTVYKRKTTQAGYNAPSTIPYHGLYGPVYLLYLFP